MNATLRPCGDSRGVAIPRTGLLAAESHSYVFLQYVGGATVNRAVNGISRIVFAPSWRSRIIPSPRQPTGPPEARSTDPQGGLQGDAN